MLELRDFLGFFVLVVLVYSCVLYIQQKNLKSSQRFDTNKTCVFYCINSTICLIYEWFFISKKNNRCQFTSQFSPNSFSFLYKISVLSKTKKKFFKNVNHRFFDKKNLVLLGLRMGHRFRGIN